MPWQDAVKIPLWRAGVHAEPGTLGLQAALSGRGNLREGKCFCSILRIVQGHFSLALIRTWQVRLYVVTTQVQFANPL